LHKVAFSKNISSTTGRLLTSIAQISSLMSDLSSSGDELSLRIGIEPNALTARTICKHSLELSARVLDALRAVDKVRRVENTRPAALRLDIRHAYDVGRVSRRFNKRANRRRSVPHSRHELTRLYWWFTRIGQPFK
jgi:hypothetical protein